MNSPAEEPSPEEPNRTTLVPEIGRAPIATAVAGFDAYFTGREQSVAAPGLSPTELPPIRNLVQFG